MDYDRVASIYDIWSADDPACEGSLSFYSAHVRSTGGTVIEVGAGNGRITIPAAECCERIFAVERSKKMCQNLQAHIAAALPEIQKRISVYQGDILSFRKAQHVSSIIIPMRTIGLFTTAEKRRELFRTCYSLLAPGGTLAFDHFICHPDPKDDNILRRVSKRTNSSGTDILWHTHEINLTSSTLDCCLIHERVRSDGQSLSRTFTDYQIAWITPEEVRSNAKLVGFSNAHVFGTFERGDFDSESAEQVWILTK